MSALGLGVPPEWCAAHEGDGRCIVGRRTFQYEQGSSVRIPVGLYRRCLGVRCDAGSTCNYEGRCVSANLDTASCSSEAGCVLPGDPPVPPGTSDDPAMPVVPPAPPAPMPLPPPPSLSYLDQDPAQGFTRGRLQIARSADESRITEYQVRWANAQGALMGVFARFSPAQADLALSVLPGTVVPTGAERFVAVAIGPAGETVSASVRADNFAKERPLLLTTGADLLVAPTGTWDNTSPPAMLTIVGTNVSGRPTIRRCAADGSNCVRRDLGNTGRYGGALTLAITGVYGGKLFILDSASNGMRLYRCALDGTACSTHDLGTDNRVEVVPSMAVDEARDRFFALSTQTDTQFAQARSMLRQCTASGDNCSRRVLPLSGRAVGHLQVLRANGDLVVSYVDGTKNNQVFVATCRPDGSTCESFAAGPVPTSAPCTVTSALSPTQDAVYVALPRGDCSSATAPGTLLVYKCTLATKTCVERSIGPPGQQSAHIVVDAPRARVIIAHNRWASAVRTDHGVHICDLSLDGCTTRSLAPVTSGGEVGSGSDPFVLLDPGGNISMLTRDARGGGTPLLSRCNANGENCVYATVSDTTSKLSLGTNGTSPSVSVDHEGNLILGADGSGSGAFIAADMHGCDDAGTCTLLARVSQAQYPTAAAWPGNKSALLVALGSAGLGIAICPTSGAACSKQDIGGDRGNFGRNSIVLPDPNGQRIDVVAYDDEANNTIRPLMTTCTANGSGCTLRKLGEEAGLPPGAMYALHAARVGDEIWVAGVLGNKTTLLRCGLTQGTCRAEELGALVIPARKGGRYSTSVVPGDKSTAVLVGSAQGVRRYDCTATSVCIDRGLLAGGPWAGEYFWLSATRDPLSDALYVAWFDGVRRVLFTTADALLLSTLRVDRCDASGCIRVASADDTIALFESSFAVYADNSPRMIGRPPSVFFDAQRRRVLAAGTSAANLFRPLVLEFDAF
jgi:hypothetical protein